MSYWNDAQNPKATVSVCLNLSSESSVSVGSLLKDAGAFDQHYTPDGLHLILKGSIKAVHTDSNWTESVVAKFGVHVSRSNTHSADFPHEGSSREFFVEQQSPGAAVGHLVANSLRQALQ